MSLLTLGLLLFLAFVCLVQYRHRGGLVWPFGAAATLVVAVAALTAGRVDREVTARLIDVPLALMAGWIAINAIGLPAPLAYRLGIGLRSREWEYDRSLQRELQRFRDAVDKWPADDPAAGLAWRESALKAGARSLRGMRKLRPPDREWSDLTAAYMRVDSLVIDEIRQGRDPARQALIAQLSERALAEHERLRAVYRARADSIRVREKRSDPSDEADSN